MSIEEIILRLNEFAAMARTKGGKIPICDGDFECICSAIALLRTHPEAQTNEPLTPEELRQMYCQPVWVQYEDDIHGSWGLVELDQITLPAGAYCIIGENRFGRGWKVYRRPPKE